MEGGKENLLADVNLKFKEIKKITVLLIRIGKLLISLPGIQSGFGSV